MKSFTKRLRGNVSSQTYFGSSYSLLSSAKAKYDPQHIFTPGYEVF